MKLSPGLSLGLFLGGTAALAADYEPPRTPNGVPDLQGTWTSATLTNLERPEEVDGLVLTPEQANQYRAPACAECVDDHSGDGARSIATFKGKRG